MKISFRSVARCATIAYLSLFGISFAGDITSDVEIAPEKEINYTFYRDGERTDITMQQIINDSIAGNKQDLDSIISPFIQEGGFAGTQALEIRDAVDYATNCVNAGGLIDRKEPVKLIRGHMYMRVNPERGSGYFDVSSIKMIECFYPDTQEFDTKILSRRWVVTVEEGLMEKYGSALDPVEDPAGNEYAYKLFVEAGNGSGINMSEFHYDNQLVNPNHPKWEELKHFYIQTDAACIDIFFVRVPPNEGNFESVPGEVAFCAGGNCKDQNPGFDATM
ncbi:MAG: hypothetical protein AAF526_00670 [Pseudomonadota bacterium]